MSVGVFLLPPPPHAEVRTATKKRHKIKRAFFLNINKLLFLYFRKIHGVVKKVFFYIIFVN